MLKIVLKEPVPDAYYKQEDRYARTMQVIAVEGDEENLRDMIIKNPGSLQDTWFSFKRVRGGMVYIPASNIAFVDLVKDSESG